MRFVEFALQPFSSDHHPPDAGPRRTWGDRIDRAREGARQRVARERQHVAPFALSLVVLVLGLVFSYRLASLAHLDEVAALRARVASQLDHVRGDLSRELFASINLSEGLVSLVRLRGGIRQDEFDALAAAMLARSSVIRNVAIAPGTVIRFVYPREGNEAALGVDYLAVSDQREMVLRAITEKRNLVAGPLSLVQGGTGIIGRMPIFRAPSAGQAQSGDGYWGIAATVISFERLVVVSGLAGARQTLRIALRGLDGTGAAGPAFWGDVDVFGEEPVLLDVPLPSGSWAIGGAPTNGWPTFQLWHSGEFLVGLGLSLALSVLMFQVLRVSRARKAEVLARQRTELELREANRALTIKEFAIESVTSGMALVGLDGRVTYCNCAFGQLLGRANRSVVGSSLAEVLGAANAAAIERGLGARSNWRGELVAFGSGGTSLELEGAADTVRGDGGEALCWVVILQDVTMRRRMMAEVERGQRLSALGVFAGGVAHDFNNLLGGVFGNVELARSALPEDSPVLPHLVTASAAFERARDLTRRLLTFAVGSPPQRRCLPVLPLLRECCGLSLSGSTATWELVYTDAEEVCEIVGDANQLSQVLTNILINARQAMAQGGRVRLTVCNRTITATEVEMVDPGRYVEISVADEGPGIPADVLPHVFDAFFTTKPSGSGLGLAMSRSIVSAHGGRLSAASPDSGGAVFSLLLPAAQSGVIEPAQPLAETPVLDARVGRIILMDDERLIRDMASRMLTRAGYEIVTARDGEEAIAICREGLTAGRPFDAAILDVTVPGGMGGKEALRVLRDVQPGLAVVLSSGYGGISTAAGECQPTAVLPKPYQMHELLACARAVVPVSRPPATE